MASPDGPKRLAVAVTLAACALELGGFAHVQKDPGRAPGWDRAFSLAVDQIIPFITVGQKGDWVIVPATPHQWFWFAGFLFVKILAWGLAALGVASVTGLIRRL